jgi:hypothetical protein
MGRETGLTAGTVIADKIAVAEVGVTAVAVLLLSSNSLVDNIEAMDMATGFDISKRSCEQGTF